MQLFFIAQLSYMELIQSGEERFLLPSLGGKTWVITLQETNLSHLGKRKFIFKNAFGGDMLVPSRVNVSNV